MTNRRSEEFAYLAALIACIPIANWMIGNVGAICVHDGPAWCRSHLASWHPAAC